MNPPGEPLSSDDDALRGVEGLRAALALVSRIGSAADPAALCLALAGGLPECVGAGGALTFLAYGSGHALVGAVSRAPLPPQLLSPAQAALLSDVASAVSRAACPLTLHADEWPALELSLGRGPFVAVPLRAGGDGIGALVVAGEGDAGDIASLLAPVVAAAEMAGERLALRIHPPRDLDAQMRQLHLLHQLDRELTETINLDHVFDLTLDWALRYTGADAGSLALYDEATGELRYVADIGYAQDRAALAAVRAGHAETPAHRAARSGLPVRVADVGGEAGHIALSPRARSQLCAPIMREERVIAVIVVESNRLDAFDEDHIAFVGKLGARAGVAIDNARLFAETTREREKLATILRSTADIVMVVNADGRVELMSDSAIPALGLAPARSYVGALFDVVARDTALLSCYRRALAAGRQTLAEVTLPSGHVYQANLSQVAGVGWIIIMHDITPLKETEHLKNELVSTVSHDLKQPLSVMRGYTELLLMRDWTEPQVTSYARMIERAVNNMRQLIDDLLDLAKLEAGAPFEPQAVAIADVVQVSLDSVREAAVRKHIRVEVTLPAPLPDVLGDAGYLAQIFTNLLTNAVKYTPTAGCVTVTAHASADSVSVAIADNGLGIAPEDQARIFDRFYRVRRPETDSIDGTGLGLAIVKRLVELHGGQIGLESRVGHGSTFYVTLPALAPIP